MSTNHQFIITQEDSENIRYQEGGKHIFFGFERGALYVPSKLVWRGKDDQPISEISLEKIDEIIQNLERWFIENRSLKINLKGEPSD